MTLASGTRLGPYEILSPLGAGGMGEVYKALDTRLERTVAVKVLPQHLSSSPEVRQRFEREAKTISQLSHPHICALYDVGHEGETEYLVMEYLEGETLSDRLGKGPMPLEQTLRFGSQMADALEKAHRQGIVHRDLKPGNVMLTRSGAKLLDFGLAKGFAESGSPPGATSLPTVMGKSENLTEKGTVLGTFQYMAPEQLEGRDADGRSDIFAFGAVLYEMATGQKAFTGASQASLISAILRDEPQPISQVQPTTPPALDRVVRTCLAKDPEERWQSAADLKRELQWIGEGSTPGTEAAAAAAPRRRSGAPAWVLAGVLALVATALAFALWRERSERPAPLHAFLDPPPKSVFEFTGDEAAPPAVSPDGASVIYGAGHQLWVQSLRTGTLAALPSSEAGRFPFWSPDGRQIAFFSGGKLKIVDSTGGPIRALADAPSARGGTWGPGGVIVFAPDFRGGLLRVAVGGGAPAPLTTVETDKHTTHRWPFFVPDGKHVVFLAADHANPRSENAGIYVVSIDGGPTRRLMSSYGSAQPVPGWLLTVRDANLMALRFDADRLTVSSESRPVAANVLFDSGTWRGVFSASLNGTLVFQSAREGGGGQLAWYDLQGRKIASIGERSEAYGLRLSPDGRRASVIEGDPNSDIWVYELDRGLRTRLTTSAQIAMTPVWAPDGSSLIYVSGAEVAKEGRFALTRIAADGSGAKKILDRSAVRIETTDWSPDGKYLLLDRGPIGASSIWVHPLVSPGKAYPFIESPVLNGQGRFSPDGRWVAYVSLETGRFEGYVAPFPGGGARVRISSQGGTQLAWRPDGKAIYYVTLDGELMEALVDGSGSRFVVHSVQPLFPVNLFVGPRVSAGFEVAPDGKRLLLNSAGDAEAPRAGLVANWTSDLPK